MPEWKNSSPAVNWLATQDYKNMKMNVLIWLLPLISGLIIAALGYFVASWRLHRQQISSLEEELDTTEEDNKILMQEVATLKASLYQQETYFKAEKANFEQTKEQLTYEFENLAHRIFEQKGATFDKSTKENITNLLQPFRQQLESFEKRVDNLHEGTLKGNAALSKEIEFIKEVGLKMSDEANNLTHALKGDSQQRGAWGEAQLEKTLEISGLIAGDHYTSQSSFVDSEGKTKRTDYLINLPDGKHLILDSKVTLNAYVRALEAESTEAYNLAIKEHVKAVRRHIDDLASKDYTSLAGVRSPDFVLMFMPIEPAYIEALKQSKDLFEYGYQKNVVLVSHTTLIPILRTVANLWRYERSTAEARELSNQAGEIYHQVSELASRFERLGKNLNTVNNQYNTTLAALVGRQGLYGKMEKFESLSHKVNNQLPLVQPLEAELQTQRLSLVLQPLVEKEQAEEAINPLTNTDNS